MTVFVVTGTDTDVGKTVFASALVAALGASYWKPIQAGGLEAETDSRFVARLAGAPADRILPEIYRLRTPASPHRAAEIDGIEIELSRLGLPERLSTGPLIIEGAGGVLVPLNRKTLQADLFAHWDCPTILVASTRLGTINHSLMSIEALKGRLVEIHGIAFVGEANEDNEATICQFGNARRLGRLPLLDPLTPEALRAAFDANFNREDFLA